MADTARSEALQVFLRVRPPIMKEVREQYAVNVRGTQSVTLVDDKKETSCSYDYVFNEISEQSLVFDKVKPLLEDVLSGVNACIFAYGQTSAGKSFTMLGPNGGQDIFRQDPEQWGILPRASEFLLGYLNEKANEGVLSYEVKASFLQIYNENLYDLLRDTGPMIDERQTQSERDKDTELKIREIPRRKTRGQPSGTKEVFVAGLSEFRVQTSEDILRILAVGANNRMTRSTDFNATSSRSHALLQLTFEIEAQTETGQTVINKSKLNLVDLAGSEKIPFVASEYNNARHMKELTSINKSLSSLGNVIAALSSNNRTHIPYRDSKLTRILQDSLSGNTRTILIACVAPTILHAAESLSTLQFADRAKNVMLSVKPNTLVDDKLLLSKAHEEITRLKALLAHALKQLEQRAKEGGSDPAELMRLQEENDGLRRDNASLKKTIKAQTGTFSQPSSHTISPVPFDQQVHHSSQPQFTQQAHQPQLQQPGSLPYLNYSVTNPTPAPMHAMAALGGQGSQNGAGLNAYQAGNRSMDSLIGKSTFDMQRFSLDQDRDKKGKKQNKARNVPPLLDLLESNRAGAGAAGAGGKSKAHKKSEVPSVAKVYSKAYKSINDKQIEELNSMLSASTAQTNLQQQQNMMQYLQQQQFLQQNFPHQQLSLPYISQPMAQNPAGAPQFPQGMGHNGHVGAVPVTHTMAAVNTMAASLLPAFGANHNGYNVNGHQQSQPGVGAHMDMPPHMFQNQAQNQNQPQPYRPAPVHYGAPFQSHNQGPADQAGGVYNHAPVLPVIPSAAPNYNHSQHMGHSSGQGTGRGEPRNHHSDDHGHRPHRDDPVMEVSPSTQESAPSPKQRSHRKKHREEPPDLTRSQSDDSVDGNPPASAAQASNNYQLGTGRSALGSSHGAPSDSGRLGTGQSINSALGSPAGHSGAGAKMPSNRIVRKGPGGKLAPTADVESDDDSVQERASRQPGRQDSANTDRGTPTVRTKSSSSSGGPINPSASQPAFLASIMSKQAQLGTPSGLLQSSGVIEPPIQRAANLSHTADDVGRAVQLFSFRMNTWDRIQIVDFDSIKRQHKVRHSDGAEQWLDLSKKPIRAIPEM